MFFQCLNVKQNKENDIWHVEQQQSMNDKIRNKNKQIFSFLCMWYCAEYKISEKEINNIITRYTSLLKYIIHDLMHFYVNFNQEQARLGIISSGCILVLNREDQNDNSFFYMMIFARFDCKEKS